MKAFLSYVLLAAMTVSLPLGAQNQQKQVNVDFNVRFDFNYDNPKYGTSHSGFQGKYLNLMLFGDINDKLSYSFRQRLNKRIDQSDVFSATDWIYLSYRPTRNWQVSAGKQVVAIGGYEYDAAPIDIYFSSMFWQNIACYQFGVSGKYISQSGNHSLTAQICNSPFLGISSSCYAYNLLWSGKMGCWSTLWSANLMETSRGHYAEFLSLGNRFQFGDVALEIDLMQRSYEKRRFWLDDYSVIARLEWKICQYVTVHAKGGYERFRPDCFGTDADGAAISKPFYGIGIDAFPIKNYRNLRIHALWNINNGAGRHGFDDAGTFVSSLSTQQIMAGLTWRCNIFSWSRKTKESEAPAQ